MRIIAGTWRGRVIEAPPGPATRPTADRVRETLFSMLTSWLGAFDGLRVADLFAGSGALGFEALSRGAAHATFVDNDPKSVAALRANAARLDASERAQIMSRSALVLPPSLPFDLIFADPPYAPGSGSAAAASVQTAGWLAPGGWLAIETARRDPVQCAGFDVAAEREVGAARLTLLVAGGPSTPS